MKRLARRRDVRSALVAATLVAATGGCRGDRVSDAPVPAVASQPAAQGTGAEEALPILPPGERGFTASGAGTTGAAAPCGPYRCTRYDTAAEAFDAVLAKRPRVLALGEAHPRRDAPDVLSATERFASELLPVARRGGADALVVELLQPPTGCPTETEAVRSAQKPVVEQQDPGNIDRFVQLGHRARELGMVPLVLEPSCEEFARVRQAGGDGVVAMLELITEHSEEKLVRLLERTQARDSLIVAYGGAMHNDLSKPDQTPPAFSFGPQLLERTAGRYVALDLIVPEYIADTPAWQKLAWYPYYPALRHPGVTLIEVGPHEYTLILRPNQARAGNATAP